MDNLMRKTIKRDRYFTPFLNTLVFFLFFFSKFQKTRRSRLFVLYLSFSHGHDAEWFETPLHLGLSCVIP